ncbi:kinase-like domain-containing protein [Mycena alexandri]|uniref:Kinase-like domain-containing protein n=1 Tax=Mycena alexandri TaxID=1745969 RepID=A0AAD6X9C6_9AGAR|nr:kinase-like domain-containing protein [Mycena alexandri]
MDSPPEETDDSHSTFSYDSEEDATPASFSTTELEKVVREHLHSDTCKLVKLAQGGYHKVYEVLTTDSKPLNVVVRVAAPAFPKDKVESEIATMQYIAEHTIVHTPRVHHWNTDHNSVGQEYMIMEKIQGVPASEVWDSLELEKKQVIVSEVAHHMTQLFQLRFSSGGSLYHGPEGKTVVGPIVATPFYQALDGVMRFPEPIDPGALAEYRGPFDTASSYVGSFLKAELHIVERHREHILQHELNGDKERLARGIEVLKKAVELSLVYPGDLCVSDPLTSPGQAFSVRMDDFRLSNIMIDDEGHIQGLIDFEGATVAPLWDCAYMPLWLQDPSEWDGSHEGGSDESLRNLFWEKVKENDPTGEWIRACERGRWFRNFTSMLSYNVGVWAEPNIEKWVDERLEWAKVNPGVGRPLDPF